MDEKTKTQLKDWTLTKSAELAQKIQAEGSAAVAALDVEKSEKLDVHDNSNQPDNPETAETKSDSNKSDVAEATTCPDILDAHLPPLPRVYPLASLRNLMFERWKKQWR